MRPEHAGKAGSLHLRRNSQAAKAPWRNTRQTDQTAADPPNQGRMTFAKSGSTKNRRKALRKTAREQKPTKICVGRVRRRPFWGSGWGSENSARNYSC